MTVQTLFTEPGRVDEPRIAQEFSAVFSQVAADGRPVILQRDGEDLAAVVSLEHLELIRELAARRDVEALAAKIDWDQARKTMRPPQEWFDGTDNPFEPDEEQAP